MSDEITERPTLSKSTRKYYKVLSSDLVRYATDDEAKPESLEFPPSICDLSDFTPLAELVRSFQPRSNEIEPEFEFPTGDDDGTYEPPHDYSDPVDVYKAIQEKKEELASSVKSRKSSKSEHIDESVKADKQALLENAGSANARVQQAEVRGAESTSE